MEGEEGSLTISDLRSGFKDTYNGKVKNVSKNDQYSLILFEYTDSLSVFNKHKCDVSQKGEILNETNAWWMEKTKHIVNNHYISHSGKNLLSKLCKRIDIEVIVRAYYTGSLTKNQNHLKYGLILPDGIKPGDPFPSLVITPTTKDDEDLPLKEDEIFEKGLATREEWENIKKVALELFRFGSKTVEEKGLILVDTKYEFGYDTQGNLTLIDEIHTGDSSRYWVKETGKNLDKDHVRRFVSQNPDADVPQNVKDEVRDSYISLYERITGEKYITSERNIWDEYIKNVSPKVVTVAGSVKDIEHVRKINKELAKEGFVYLNYFHSAHKETKTVLKLIEQFEKEKVVFVAVAGLSNALGGVLSANSSNPVINCPPFKNDMDMMTNINSSLMMPSGVPTALVIRPDNLARFIKKITRLQ